MAYLSHGAVLVVVIVIEWWEEESAFSKSSQFLSQTENCIHTQTYLLTRAASTTLISAFAGLKNGEKMDWKSTEKSFFSQERCVFIAVIVSSWEMDRLVAVVFQHICRSATLSGGAELYGKTGLDFILGLESQTTEPVTESDK